MTPRIPVLALTCALSLAHAAAAVANARVNGESGTRSSRNRLAAGQHHTCAILDDGTVQCWGRNNHGQLGDGTVVNRLTPVAVSGLGTVVSIVAGSDHTCAILSGGTASCWGFNDSGQLGNGTASQSLVPVAVSGLTNAIAMAAGFLHTCALRVDGTVWCWGAATMNGRTAGSTSPLKVNLTGAVALSAGVNHTCAVIADGTVKCWGQNASGQLGDGDNNSTATPTSVLTAFKGQTRVLDSVVDVSAGGSFTCARLSAAATKCWGDNSFGQLGNGTTTGGNLATFADPKVAGVIPKQVALAEGGAHSCWLLEDGSIVCAGLDDALQLGDRISSGFSVTFLTVPAVLNAIEIAAGVKHSCAAIVDGTIRCWGDNTYGQHGDGTSGQVGVDSVSGISGTFLGRGVAAGNQFPCARRGSGAAACWGAGTHGQLGNGASVSSLNPVAVSGLANAVAATAGGAHACALDATGHARCWGSNARGELGDGTTHAANQPVVVQTAGNVRPISSFSAIAAARNHTCAIGTGGPVYCWGAGTELGVAQDETLPGEVVFSDGALALAVGDSFACTVTPLGTVTCWGDNSSGQLGNGFVTPSDPGLPNPVPGLFNVVGVSAGADHACAVTAFGSILCWGGNSRGQIGNNSTTVAPFPTTVQGITDAISVSAGAFYTCAVRANGAAACWGANDAGELGVKDSADHLTPTPVVASVFSLPTGGTTAIALSGVVAIATGSSTLSPTHEQTCALLATGVVRCWGDNAQGEIGNGTTVNQQRPTVVNSFAANVDPDAMLRHDRVAIVTALIDCEAGDEAHIFVTLEQGTSSGAAHEAARCDGRLLRVPIRIDAFHRGEFHAGAATARLEAIVHHGRDVVEDTHWTRDVVLAADGHRIDHDGHREQGDSK